VIPFITERIWEQLNEIVAYRGPASTQAEPLLVKAAWPRARAEWLNRWPTSVSACSRR